MTKVPPWPPADYWDRPEKKLTLDDLNPFGRNNPVIYSTLALISAGHDSEQALINALGYLCSQYDRLYAQAIISRLYQLENAPPIEVPKKS